MIIDVKPKLAGVKDEKSKILVSDTKPRLSFIGKEQEIYTGTKMIYKGQPMGLLLSLTYPIDITSEAVRT